MNISATLDRTRKNLARVINVPHGQFALFMYLERTVQYAFCPDGALFKEKHKMKLQDAMIRLIRVYRTYLKPAGGSHAGNEAKDGEHDLSAVVALLTEEDPDENFNDKYSLAADYLKNLILFDLRQGHLRNECEKFNEHFDGASPSLNVYSLLDEMMNDLMPLEALMLGPSICLDLDRHHVLNFDATFPYAEIQRESQLLHEAFRQTTHASAMSNDLEAHRREIIKDLMYLGSKAAHHRIGAGAEPGFLRASANELLRKICITRPALSVAAVDSLMLELRQQHPKAHLSTKAWQPGGVGPRGRAAAAKGGPQNNGNAKGGGPQNNGNAKGGGPQNNGNAKGGGPQNNGTAKGGGPQNNGTTKASPWNRNGGNRGGTKVTITEDAA